MFEKAPDDGGDPDVFRKTGDARTKGAHAAHDQVHLDAGAGCRIQGLDQAAFHQGIHLGDDMRTFARFGEACLAMDGREQAVMQREGRQQQAVQVARASEARELLEHVADILADAFIAGQQAEIGVEPRGARMVVAGGHVDIALEAPGFAANDQQHLRVCLESHHAIDNVGADLFELGGPGEVGLFVEAGQQFDNHGHLLAALGRIDQVLHQHRVGAGAIHGLLDGDDVGVGCGLIEKINDRGEGLIRVMQQDFALADGCKQVR